MVESNSDLAKIGKDILAKEGTPLCRLEMRYNLSYDQSLFVG